MDKKKKIVLTILLILFSPYVITVFMHGTWEREPFTQPIGPELVITTVQGTETIPIEEYLEGVIAPYLFQDYNDEELKAISVILRTNLVLDLQRGIAPQLERMSYAEQREMFGEEYDANQIRIDRILTDTTGQILLYEGSVVEVPFFHFQNKNDPYLHILNDYYSFYTIYQYW